MNNYIKRRFYSLSTALVPMQLRKKIWQRRDKVWLRHGCLIYMQHSFFFLFHLWLFFLLVFSSFFLHLILSKNFFFVLETDYIQDTTQIKWSYLFIIIMMMTIELCPSLYFSFISFRKSICWTRKKWQFFFDAIHTQRSCSPEKLSAEKN